MNYAAGLVDGDFASIPIRDLIEWRKQDGAGVLRLPPIQRSLVWRNEQIIRYWDSLLRGYPPGQFLVHRVSDAGTENPAGSSGSDASGKLAAAHPDDWQLFDGQQRMSALLLGRGEGQLKDDLRLWIDFGVEPNQGSDLRFTLRISSRGQPFGYRADSPNRKLELAKRSDWWKDFEEANSKLERDKAFGDKKAFLIGEVAAVPMAEVWDACDGGWISIRDKVLALAPEKSHADIEKRGQAIMTALASALDRNALVSKLPAEIVQDPDEYLRFFGRVGQGGTALTDNELTYSILKQKFPHLRDRMAAMSDLRFASDVDLVLAAVRVARLRVERLNAETETIARPTPQYVRGMKEEVRGAFLELLPEGTDGCLLQHDLDRILKTLDGAGMHRMLTARLPREAVDILLLLVEITRGDEAQLLDTKLPAVALFCLVGLQDAGKAADRLFCRASGSAFSVSAGHLTEWRNELLKEDIAYHLPEPADFAAWRNHLNTLAPEEAMQLPGWNERFAGCDTDERRPGDWMRHLSSNREWTKRSLMWVQSEYLKKTAGSFDPLSARDDDLPLDLDHIVPNSVFGFHWSDNRRKKRAIEDSFEKSFWRNRGIVGNALGNFRWLCARENRSRGNGGLVDYATLASDHLIDHYEAWHALVGTDQTPWTRERVGSFRKLTEIRALGIAEKLVHDMSF